MRRIIAAAVSLCLLFCVGCSGKAVNVDCRGISFDFALENEEQSVSVNAISNENGDILFSITGGNIDGLKVQFAGESIKTEFLGITEEFTGDTDFGVLSAIYNIFSALHNAEVQKSGDEYIAEHSLKDINATLTVTELGLPIALTLGETEIQFNNIKVI